MQSIQSKKFWQIKLLLAKMNTHNQIKWRNPGSNRNFPLMVLSL